MEGIWLGRKFARSAKTSLGVAFGWMGAAAATLAARSMFGKITFSR